MRLTRFLLAGLAVTGGLLISGCGSSSNSADQTSTRPPVTVTVTQPSTSTTPATTGTGSTPQTTTTPTTTTGSSTTTTGTTSSTTATLPACVAADLKPRFLGTNGAAGTIAIGFAVTNISNAACQTYGWPGVQFLSSNGTQLPTNAFRTSSDLLGSTAAALITLQPGQQASFRMIASQFAESSNTTCQTASALQIIAPNDSATLEVSLNGGVPACGKATLSPMMAGTGAWPTQ